MMTDDYKIIVELEHSTVMAQYELIADLCKTDRQTT